MAAFALLPLQYTTARIRPKGSSPIWLSSSSTKARVPRHRDVKWSVASAAPASPSSGASIRTRRIRRVPSTSSVSPSTTRVTFRSVQSPADFGHADGSGDGGGGSSVAADGGFGRGDGDRGG